MSLIQLGLAGAIFAAGFHIPMLTAYNTDIIIRYITAYMTIYVIAQVMEMSRGYAQAQLNLSNRKLEKAFNKVQEKTTDLFESNRELQNEVKERRRIEKALRDSEFFFGQHHRKHTERNQRFRRRSHHPTYQQCHDEFVWRNHFVDRKKVPRVLA